MISSHKRIGDQVSVQRSIPRYYLEERWDLLVKKRKQFSAPWLVSPINCQYLLTFIGMGNTPITHQIHSDPKHAQQVHTRLLHSSVGVSSELIIECAARVCVGPYVVSCLSERKSEERGAYYHVRQFDIGVFRYYAQTSVTMPARMICFFPVAWTAARKSGLSQASTWITS